MSKEWSNPAKDEVRSIIAKLSSGKQYSKLVDLPGNQILSVLEFLKEGSINPGAELVLVEKDIKEGERIREKMKNLPNNPYTLRIYDIEKLKTDVFNNVGLFNLDLMSHLTPPLMHLIDRVQYGDDAFLSITLYHSNIRAYSKFLKELYKDFSNWHTNYSEYERFANNYHYLTYKQRSELIHLQESETIDKHILYSYFLYYLLKYALRNHEYQHMCSILYSSTPTVISSLMITFIFTGITRVNDSPPNAMVLDTLGFSDMRRELNKRFS